MTKPIVMMTGKVQAIHLPDPVDKDLAPNTKMTVSGWGLTEKGKYPKKLRATSVLLKEENYCKSKVYK